MLKGYRFHRDIPVLTAGGASTTLSNANSAEKASDSLFGSLTQTFGSRAVNEVKGGYAGYFSYTAAMWTSTSTRGITSTPDRR